MEEGIQQSTEAFTDLHSQFAKGDDEHTKIIQYTPSNNTHGALGAFHKMPYQMVLKKPNNHRMREKKLLANYNKSPNLKRDTSRSNKLSQTVSRGEKKEIHQILQGPLLYPHW